MNQTKFNAQPMKHKYKAVVVIWQNCEKSQSEWVFQRGIIDRL